MNWAVKIHDERMALRFVELVKQWIDPAVEYQIAHVKETSYRSLQMYLELSVCTSVDAAWDIFESGYELGRGEF